MISSLSSITVDGHAGSSCVFILSGRSKVEGQRGIGAVHDNNEDDNNESATSFAKVHSAA